jgi:succinate-acetate transporter protein
MYGTDEVVLVRQTTDSQQLVTRRCVRIARLLFLFLFLFCAFGWIIFLCCLLAWSKLSFVFYLFHICFLLFFTEGLEMTEL